MRRAGSRKACPALRLQGQGAPRERGRGGGLRAWERALHTRAAPELVDARGPPEGRARRHAPPRAARALASGCVMLEARQLLRAEPGCVCGAVPGPAHRGRQRAPQGWGRRGCSFGFPAQALKAVCCLRDPFEFSGASAVNLINKPSAYIVSLAKASRRDFCLLRGPWRTRRFASTPALGPA
ncbi:unnamed protein product [Rangifer tarandus platyrhynchus]|uniref:Uncharacterized protein n=1 Tax=Rangifer tarandus platyrhynchus TaxID=3082113 RepID=A0AC59ZYW4_RANTA